MADTDRFRPAHWARRLLGRRSVADRTRPSPGHAHAAGGGVEGTASSADSAGTGNGLAAHHRRTIERGAGAVDDLTRAASFASGGGVSDLGRAVRAAERAGADEAATRGRRALAAFERFRRAANGHDADASTQGQPSHSPHEATS